MNSLDDISKHDIVNTHKLSQITILLNSRTAGPMPQGSLTAKLTGHWDVDELSH
jgi:hypothetical protein